MTVGSVAVTGARGRLGGALVEHLATTKRPFHAWNRPEIDLDRPLTLDRLVRRHRPAVVIHTAAWTDVDACARQPELARRRNGRTVGVLAGACRHVGSGLVVVSTNEVFDGARSDQRGYVETDEPSPVNAYGASKLEGEVQAAQAFAPTMRGTDVTGLWIVRTAWLFGPPGADFPRKILAAAGRLPPGEALPVVTDEIGSPTYATDLAAAILQLIEAAPGGLFHLVNGGATSRYEWAKRILRRCGSTVPVEAIRRTAFVRASTPPSWAVLDASRAARLGVRMRSWGEAFEDYAASICP